GLGGGEPDLDGWRSMVLDLKGDHERLPIALVGKYVELQDAYISVREALCHAGILLGRSVDIDWISSEELERGRDMERLTQVAGIVVPGGFGYRGIEGKIVAARYARMHGIPYLGLCLGLQVMVIELARHALKSEEPNSTEFDHATPIPVIDLMPDQRDIGDMGGTMRLGVYPCNLVPGTRAAAAYGSEQTDGRHRHRFEVNNAYRTMLSQAGMVFSGLSSDGRLVEVAELSDHPWMLGTQFHPEFQSRPTRPHPLFHAFLKAAIEQEACRRDDKA
ncbi:MAG TPA: CTP synthase, partial [Anaerolineae bacterium]|nr:CTP synthase [Anaerolineae bacterium]